MGTRNTLVSYLDGLLRTPQPCEDVSNNGLQVEGRSDVTRVVFAVDASRELFVQAVAMSADFIVVHHGISWGNNLRRLTGLQASRLRLLFRHDISLYASHLPLDAHPEVGNNTVIAARLELREQTPFATYGGVEVGCHGLLPRPLALVDFIGLVDARLETGSRVLSTGADEVRHVGVVSGAGADVLDACAQLGIDCLVTGEFGHVHVHPAREFRVNLVAAGHYRTEVCGISALMNRVAADLDLDCEFVDIPTDF